MSLEEMRRELHERFEHLKKRKTVKQLTSEEAIEIVRRGEYLTEEQYDNMRVDELLKFLKWLV